MKQGRVFGLVRCQWPRLIFPTLYDQIAMIHQADKGFMMSDVDDRDDSIQRTKNKGSR